LVAQRPLGQCKRRVRPVAWRTGGALPAPVRADEDVPDLRRTAAGRRPGARRRRECRKTTSTATRSEGQPRACATVTRDRVAWCGRDAAAAGLRYPPGCGWPAARARGLPGAARTVGCQARGPIGGTQAWRPPALSSRESNGEGACAWRTGLARSSGGFLSGCARLGHYKNPSADGSRGARQGWTGSGLCAPAKTRMWSASDTPLPHKSASRQLIKTVSLTLRAGLSGNQGRGHARIGTCRESGAGELPAQWRRTRRPRLS